MRKFLSFILFLLFSVSLNICAQVEITNGKIHYGNNEETMYLSFKGKSLNELMDKSIVFLEESYDCNIFKSNNRLEVEIKNNEIQIGKNKCRIEYKIIFNFKEDGVYIFSPQIDDIFFVKSNNMRVYLDRGSNNINSVYIYKKNGELRYKTFESDLTISLNNILNKYISYINNDSNVFQKIWHDRDYMLYNKSLFKIKNNYDWFFGLENAFYTSIEKAINKLDVAYNKGKNITDIEKLKNRIFKVDSIHLYKRETFGIEHTEKLFELRDTSTNEVLFYIYPVIEDDFPFLCCNVKQEYDKNDLKNQIEKRVDDFSGRVEFNSELFQNAVVYKYIKDDTTKYYLKLKTVGYTLNVNCNGVSVIFDDGTKWEKQSEVSVDVKEGDGWYYSSFIELSDNDVNLFASKKIKKYKLYIYEDDLGESFSNIFRIYVDIIRDFK